MQKLLDDGMMKLRLSIILITVNHEGERNVDILFRDWYTFIYPSFFLVSDSFKEAYKNQETEALISLEIPRLYILLRPLLLPFLLC